MLLQFDCCNNGDADRTISYVTDSFASSPTAAAAAAVANRGLLYILAPGLQGSQYHGGATETALALTPKHLGVLDTMHSAI